jgi:mono/diheme cytochrome c family protein
MKKILAILLAVIVLAALGGTAFVWSGVYNIAASSQHTQPVYSLLERTMHQSVRLRASAIEPPALNVPGMFERGAACYRAHCEQCHGGPGVAQHAFALGMQPLPGPLVNAPSRWEARDVYWIIVHGITMSGMPAWKYRLHDSDIWSTVAFVERMPLLSAVQYRDVMAQVQASSCGTLPHAAVAPPPAAGDAARGKLALSQYGCNGCHLIPGITGSVVHVGPPLGGIARRQLIGGRVANTQDNMILWLRDPQAVDRLTTMPNLGVTERDARDITSYLATLL